MTGHRVKVTRPGEQSWPTTYLESITIASTRSPAPPASIHPHTHLASIDWLKTRAYQLKCQVARGTSNMISKSITHFFRRNAMPSAVEGYWISAVECRWGLLDHNDKHYTTYNTSAFNQNCTIDNEPFGQSGELTIPDTKQRGHKNIMPGANPSSGCHDTMPSILPTRHECSTGE